MDELSKKLAAGSVLVGLTKFLNRESSLSERMLILARRARWHVTGSMLADDSLASDLSSLVITAMEDGRIIDEGIGIKDLSRCSRWKPYLDIRFE